jgi:hypothetical protein
MSEAQLRLYRITDGHLADFVEEWRASVLPLRERFGFQSEVWTDASQNAFVWLLRYSGDGTLAEADAAYYASPERAAMDPDPARWIDDTMTLALSVVPGATP